MKYPVTKKDLERIEKGQKTLSDALDSVREEIDKLKEDNLEKSEKLDTILESLTVRK